ncbi:hypothetical protein A2851_01070 [Candidatus Kaiserbacteria bacterium RIFCSPHIGHO2_01_FULL_53_29]|uniref:DUF3298 domain-containing protein n=1 Tax=Candidatus Kaiserbacteria bacterium RIFCSPHIGHO2_01_FULL_53_29 TaxID=1798480 RepID=A0A1F6CZH7_9BACT|nr:MAG: hypothetical protein A2851_01070 [Candidatus Kaiserbacteria bacterium RIFCSPHIGHO2_01_FULL_53_29]
MSRLFTYLVALVVFLGAGYFLVTRLQAPQISTVATTTPQVQVQVQDSVRITTANVQEETPQYKIDVQYPQFGMPVIDAQIKKNVDETITEVKGFPANPPDLSSPQNELTMRFDSAYIGPDVISVKLIISQYTGGAHPNTLFSGLNFDRASNQQLLQDDAFKMIGLTVAQVSVAATEQLKSKLGEGMFTEGANSNPGNFSSFVISAEKVTFIFQPYQVAAYAAGPQEVSFARVK